MELKRVEQWQGYGTGARTFALMAPGRFLLTYTRFWIGREQADPVECSLFLVLALVIVGCGRQRDVALGMG